MMKRSIAETTGDHTAIPTTTTKKPRLGASPSTLRQPSSTPQDGTFHLFLHFPGEIQDLIWDAAARPMDMARKCIHYFTEAMALHYRHDGSLAHCRTVLQPDLARSAFAADTALWTVCQRANTVMNRRYATEKWYRASGYAATTTDVPPAQAHINDQWMPFARSGGGGRGVEHWIPRTDLVVFDANAKLPSTWADRPWPTSRGFGRSMLLPPPPGPVAAFPEGVLRHPAIKRAGLENLAFSIGPDLLELDGMPLSFGPPVIDRAIGFTSISQTWLRKLWHMLALSQPTQLWLTDPDLRVPPGGWTPPPDEHRAVFHGDGYRLVEVRLADYGVEPALLVAFLNSVKYADTFQKGFHDLRMAVRRLWKEDESRIRGATQDLATFGAALAMNRQFGEVRPYAANVSPFAKDCDKMAQVLDMMSNFKVLALDGPAGEQGPQQPASGERFKGVWKQLKRDLEGTMWEW